MTVYVSYYRPAFLEPTGSRLYVRDYKQKKATLYTGDTVIQCEGHWLDVDGCGYYGVSCKSQITPGDRCYYRDNCQCPVRPYCSQRCAYGKPCGNYRCQRVSCKHCHIVKGGDRCVYCAHQSDDCSCASGEACNDSDTEREAAERKTMKKKKRQQRSHSEPPPTKRQRC
jgi:hypothetical protein